MYGTTLLGGTLGCGIVCSLAPGGTETILHNFGETGDGCTPGGGPLIDNAGYLYGAIVAGGADSGGVIYKITS